MYQGKYIGAVENFEAEMQRYRMEITALQEIRWPGHGVRDISGGRVMYSGRKDGKHEEGVGFFVCKQLMDDVYEFEPISSRLARIRIKAKWFNITVIALHAPTEVSPDNMKDRVTYLELFF